MSRSPVQRRWIRVEWSNLRWGIRYGLMFAALYCLYVLVIFALGGEAPFRAYNVTLGSTLALYIASGLAAGAVVGLLRPLTKTRVGAAVVGVMAAVPISWMLMRTVGLVSGWDLLISVGALSLFWGIGGGLGIQRIFSKRRRGGGTNNNEPLEK